MMIHIQSEEHPLPPFFPENAVALMLGSFPPGRSKWKMDFFYPNFQNDMWRIFGLVFFDDKDYFLTADKKSFHEQMIRSFLEQKGIALYDTAQEVIREKGNASDKHLIVVRPIDLKDALQRIPHCRSLVLTGQKAMDTLLTLMDVTEPKVGGYVETVYEGHLLHIYRMPSSSRAYPKPLTEKAIAYDQMFRELGLKS